MSFTAEYSEYYVTINLNNMNKKLFISDNNILF